MTDDVTVTKTTQSVFDAIFAMAQPPLNALIRDNARSIHEYALHRNCLPADIAVETFRPPYTSPWPIEHVPDSLIETYTQTYNNGYVGTDEIVGSTVNDGDFARYVIDYHIHDWSPAPIGTSKLPTDRDVYEEWLADFDVNATEEAKLAYDIVQSRLSATDGQAVYAETPERKSLKQAEEHFHKEIGDSAWEEYRVRAKGQLRNIPSSKPRSIKTHDGNVLELPDNFQPSPTQALFDTLWARRWICKRAHELGWNAQLHDNFDRWTHQFMHGRNEHRVERIGKKYQWLALYELRARMADNLAFVKRYGDSDDQYEGEWQASLRDCDPSLLIDKTQNNGWYQNKEAVWWMPMAPQMEEVSPQERLDWMKSDNDIIDGPDLIAVHDRDNGTDWLTMWGFGSWSQKPKNEIVSYGYDRDTWGRISCIIVDKKDEGKLFKDLKGRRLTSPHTFGRYEFSSNQYIGEYPWHPSFRGYLEWNNPDEDNNISVPIRQASAEYLCEGGSYDYSISDTITVRLPAPWLMDAMNLSFSNGRELIFKNIDGVVHFFDPSVKSPGPQSALVDKGAFLAMLEREGLAAYWIVAGEKGVYGRNHGFGGRRVFSSIYTLKDKDVVLCDSYVEWDKPSQTQLNDLLGTKTKA